MASVMSLRVAWAASAGEARLPYRSKRATAALQLRIVALLAEKPSPGDALIKALAERSGGFDCPSSGMVYPTLLGLGLQDVLLRLIAGVCLSTYQTAKAT